MGMKPPTLSMDQVCCPLPTAHFILSTRHGVSSLFDGPFLIPFGRVHNLPQQDFPSLGSNDQFPTLGGRSVLACT